MLLPSRRGCKCWRLHTCMTSSPIWTSLSLILWPLARHPCHKKSLLYFHMYMAGMWCGESTYQWWVSAPPTTDTHHVPSTIAAWWLKLSQGCSYSVEPREGWVIMPYLLLLANFSAPVQSSPFLCPWCSASTIQSSGVGNFHGLPCPSLRAWKSTPMPIANHQKWSHLVAMGFAWDFYFH